MADIQTNLTDLQNNAGEISSLVTDISEAIVAKGGTLPSNAGLRSFADAIGTIPSGGILGTKSIVANGTYQAESDNLDGYSSVSVAVPNTYAVGDEGKVVSNGALVAQTAMSSNITENGTVNTTLYNSVTVNVPSITVKPVRFYDYDGTLVASYTPQEFAALESLPDNPTHTGLTSQGWNWTLSDAKTFVANNGRIDIGQLYVTDDGRTRFYITLKQGRTWPYFKLRLTKNTTVDIDWGDGSEHSELSNTGSTTYVGERHYYDAPGDYIISIKVTSGLATLWSSSSSISTIISNGNASSNSPDAEYTNSVTRIELGSDFTDFTGDAYSFFQFYSLESITIHNAVSGIGNYAFSQCSKLKCIVIPSSTTNIENHAFDSCYGLKVACLPITLVMLNTYAFTNCTTMESIVLPGSLTTIGSYAFSNNNKLVEIIIGLGITTIIGTYVFTLCRALESIKFPTGFTTIGQYAFNECFGLKNVDIPDSLTTVGSAAFYNCRSLENITFPSGVSIGSNAFAGCYSMRELCLPSTVSSLGSGAFYACKSISVYNPPDTNSVPSQVCQLCYSLSEVTITPSVQTIGSDAFKECAYIRLIRFEALVPPTIGNSVGFPCQSYTRIIVPFASYDAYMRPKTNYPDPMVYNYFAYETYENGVTLPTSSNDGAYSYVWYASLDDAEAGQNPITEGNGNEVYAVATQYIVSIVVDFTNNTMTQVGNPQALTIFSNIIRCDVDDDGTITKRKGESGYSDTGSKGQVMSYIPKFYYKMTPITLDGNHIRKAKWEVAETKLDNSFKVHPAFIDVNGNEIDYFLYGAFEAVGQNSSGTYNTSYNTTDHKLSSAGGYTPTGTFTRATARTMAANRGTGWYVTAIKQTAAVQLLAGIEFGFNSQLGVGNGVVNNSAMRATNYGSNDGKSSSGSQSSLATVVYYRGIENIWGNSNGMIDGINTNGTSVYICDDYNFADDTDTGYTALSFTMPTAGYITAFGYDANYDWILIPSESSNEDNRSGPIGDYVNTPAEAGWTVPLLGGAHNYGSANAYQAGLFNYVTTNALATTAAAIGSRVMFVPTANV